MNTDAIAKSNTHVHSNGYATNRDVLDLAKKYCIDLNSPDFSYIDPHTGVRIWAGEHHSISHKAYGQTVDIIKKPEDVMKVTLGGLTRDAQQGCIYTRLLTSGSNNYKPHIGLDLIDVFESNILATVAAIKEVRLLGMETFISVTAKRHLPYQEAHRLLDAVEAFQKKHPDEAYYITGFDMAGNEEHANCSEFYTVFERAHRLGLDCSCHAGEVLGPDDIRAAIKLPGVKILSHILSAISDPALIEEIRQKNILVEQLLMSNGMLHGWRFPKPEDHPAPYYANMGLPLALGTDDPGLQRIGGGPCPLGTNIGDEYRIANECYGFKPEQLLLFTRNAVLYGFMPEQVKMNRLKLIADNAREIGLVLPPMQKRSDGYSLQLDI